MNTPRLALGDLSNQKGTIFNSQIYQKVSQSSAVFSKYSRQNAPTTDTPFFQKEDFQSNPHSQIFPNAAKSRQADLPIPEEPYLVNKENLEGIFSQPLNSQTNNSKRFKVDPEERFGSPYNFSEV